MAFDDFDTQIQCDEIKDWYDYEMYFGVLLSVIYGPEEELSRLASLSRWR